MKYQDCIEAAQAPGRPCGEKTAGDFAAGEPHINPITGLCTDYLNHFNEPIMLLEMLPGAPDCLDDFLRWRPMSYREHFAASHFKGRAMAIAAYDAADPHLRGSLNALAATMSAILLATGAALRSELSPDATGRLAAQTSTWLKPLVARAGAIINGDADADEGTDAAPQAVVDSLMQRSAS
jgi:hypothetical protein